MTFTLERRRALVTAAAAGIGRTIAEQLVSDAAHSISGQAIPVDSDATSLG